MEKKPGLVVEDAEAAALNHGSHIAAAESERGVGGGNGISDDGGPVVIGIGRILAQDHAAKRIAAVADIRDRKSVV